MEVRGEAIVAIAVAKDLTVQKVWCMLHVVHIAEVRYMTACIKPWYRSDDTEAGREEFELAMQEGEVGCDLGIHIFGK
jgi:hypothetical protein